MFVLLFVLKMKAQANQPMAMAVHLTALMAQAAAATVIGSRQ